MLLSMNIHFSQTSLLHTENVTTVCIYSFEIDLTTLDYSVFQALVILQTLLYAKIRFSNWKDEKISNITLLAARFSFSQSTHPSPEKRRTT